MKKGGPPASSPTKDEEDLYRVEATWSKAAYGLRTGVRYGHDNERRTQTLVEVLANLEARRLRFKAGDKLELLHAIDQCNAEGLPLPTWLARAFHDALQSAMRNGGSLADAFGWPGGKRARKARDDWDMAVRIWRAMRRIRGKTMSFDSALRLALDKLRESDPARAWPGKTKARALVLRVEKYASAGAPAFSHLRVESRKRVTR